MRVVTMYVRWFVVKKVKVSTALGFESRGKIRICGSMLFVVQFIWFANFFRTFWFFNLIGRNTFRNWFRWACIQTNKPRDVFISAETEHLPTNLTVTPATSCPRLDSWTQFSRQNHELSAIIRVVLRLLWTTHLRFRKRQRIHWFANAS